MARRPLAPAQFLAISFGGLIIVGTALLALPIAAEPGQQISLVNAFFTATSAICVTGLVVVDTSHAFSMFGEVVVAALIQVGGLGYMTLSTVFAALIGKRLSLQERLILHESLNLDTREGIVRFAGMVAKTTFTVEAAGAILLALRWTPEFGLGQATYLGAFHAISAFNNAGFSLFSTNLMAYRGDVVVNAVVTGLIIAGGLGFLVLKEVGATLRRRGGIGSKDKMSTHARMVLILTAALLVSATVAILLFEAKNPATLGQLGWGEALLAAWFQAVTPRTAGFNTIDIGAMRHVSLFLLIVLMFIGASPGGTGGGVKTTTFGVTVAALWATVRGHGDTVFAKRRIPPEVVSRAFFISLIAFLALNLIAGLLLTVEGREMLPTLFETTSAFGTVGLSMGQPGSVLSLAGHFTTPGKLLLVLMMFVGRVGPLTLAIAVVGRPQASRIRYPEAKVLIG